MKKILAALTIVAMLSIASSAMAKGVKAPKSICLDIDEQAGLFMAMKKGGALPLGSGKFTLYNIQGTLDVGGLYPCVGTGYMNGSVFIFHVSTRTDYAAFSMTGYFDLGTNTGFLDTVRSEEIDGVVQFTDDLFGLDCESIVAMVFSEPSSDVPSENNPFIAK